MSFFGGVLVVFFYLAEGTESKKNHKHNNILNTENTNSNTPGSRLRDKTTRRNQPPKSEKPKTSKENTCDICGKSFSWLSNLRRHAVVHTNLRNYKCEFCSKSFKLHASLKGHKTVAHSSEQAIGDDQTNKCEICGKRVASSWDLAGHMRVHSKERPFLCDLCGWSFGISSNLYRHRRSVHPQMTTVI
ncbi:hypothetical protein CRM22_007384 [Opisthorchis felineus]|uniref:C2H2-type domain-containing protein n=1 Tax=Opisthorchis felineus TaxID=147828 RepID=A0A4S2LNZ5_OPIFE|nr:hypothetical protein CRM22_007384 [Opisthorchis felineus]